VRSCDGILFWGRCSEDRFRKPLAGIHFSAMLRGPKLVDGKTGHNCGQPSFCILNRCTIGLLQTQKSFLHDIFGFNRTSEIAVRER
jgi:hypothetical protein